ncbi:MAG TPA: hypothetical protein VI643_05690 [Planctomycetota bacterium]|nr:hypothetical protein [Planctomycetota bacterium]
MKKILLRGLLGAIPIVAAIAFVVVDYVVIAGILRGAAVWLEALVTLAAGRDRASLSESSSIAAWFFSWGSTVAAVLILLLPLLAAAAWMSTRLGRRISAALRRRLERLPVIGTFAAISRVLRKKVDQELVQKKFRSVVLVPFGGPSFALGVVTAEGPGSRIVLVPSSPLSLQGRLLIVPAERAVPAAIPIDHVFRTVASWGIVPPREG